MHLRIGMQGSQCFVVTINETKARATPFVSVSVPVSVIRTRVRHFELHFTTFSCQISDDLDLIWPDNTLHS